MVKEESFIDENEDNLKDLEDKISNLSIKTKTSLKQENGNIKESLPESKVSCILYK